MKNIFPKMFGRFKIMLFFTVAMIASAAVDVLETVTPELEKLERIRAQIDFAFNSRAQIDLIDMQTMPDGEYKWKS